MSDAESANLVMPRRRSTGEQLASYNMKRMSLDTPKKSLFWDTDSDDEDTKMAKEEEKKKRAKYDPSISFALDCVRQHGKITSAIRGELEKCLIYLTGAGLLKMGLQVKEVLIYGEDLFRKRCEIECANPDGKPDGMKWHIYYANFYFGKQKREGRKIYQWESEYLTMMAVNKVTDTKRIRDENRAKIFDIEIPKMDRTKRMLQHPETEAAIAKAKAVEILPPRLSTSDLPTLPAIKTEALPVPVKEEPKAEIEVEKEEPKPLTACQKWHLKIKARAQLQASQLAGKKQPKKTTRMMRVIAERKMYN